MLQKTDFETERDMPSKLERGHLRESEVREKESRIEGEMCVDQSVRIYIYI